MCVRHTASSVRSPLHGPHPRFAGRCRPSRGLRLLGITGAPGAGKSTLAAALAAAYDGVVVPMDGFHLADVELTRRGLLDRKGAPETFDAEGYAALLARIRARTEATVLAPRFDRRPRAAGGRRDPGAGRRPSWS